MRSNELETAKRLAVLEGEEKSLEGVRSDLTMSDRRLERLPTCSATECSLEKIVDAWETLGQLERCYNEVLASRQTYLQGISASETGTETPPEFLYDTYPALQAIATRIEHIYASRDDPPEDDPSASRDGTAPVRGRNRTTERARSSTARDKNQSSDYLGVIDITPRRLVGLSGYRDREQTVIVAPRWGQS